MPTYHTVSGSSHENAMAGCCGLGRFFLRDGSCPLPLGAFHSSHRKMKLKRLVGQAHGENSLRQHGVRQFLGILRL